MPAPTTHTSARVSAASGGKRGVSPSPHHGEAVPPESSSTSLSSFPPRTPRPPPGVPAAGGGRRGVPPSPPHGEAVPPESSPPPPPSSRPGRPPAAARS